MISVRTPPPPGSPAADSFALGVSPQRCRPAECVGAGSPAVLAGIRPAGPQRLLPCPLWANMLRARLLGEWAEVRRTRGPKSRGKWPNAIRISRAGFVSMLALLGLYAMISPGQTRAVVQTRSAKRSPWVMARGADGAERLGASGEQRARPGWGRRR